MTATPIQFRQATEGDAVTIAALSVQVFLQTYATEGVRPDLAREAFHTYSQAAFAQRLCDPSRKFVLAESGDGLLGFAELNVSNDEAPCGNVRGAELVRLYVQPRFQRQGLGRGLIESAHRIAASCSADALWLTAWEGNEAALAFYRRLGYRDMGATTYTIEGRAYPNRVLAISTRPHEHLDR